VRYAFEGESEEFPQGCLGKFKRVEGEGVGLVVRICVVRVDRGMVAGPLGLLEGPRFADVLQDPRVGGKAE
jgi:hypothetical protein